ncbi:MAG TPA: hypothetical protein VJB63_03835 [Patescibacteria group bacterium]|nr:hypothetical protein [Patescibacteria group bacterium]
MCFAIPYKIKKKEKNTATLEDGRIIQLNRKMELEKGDYIRLIGDVIVDTISKQEGMKIRRFISSLYH